MARQNGMVGYKNAKIIQSIYIKLKEIRNSRSLYFNAILYGGHQTWAAGLERPLEAALTMA